MRASIVQLTSFTFSLNLSWLDRVRESERERGKDERDIEENIQLETGESVHSGYVNKTSSEIVFQVTVNFFAGFKVVCLSLSLYI